MTNRATPPPDLDHLGVRRLGRREELFWYVAAAVSYVALGVFHKWLLNWVVGPAWLVGFVTLGPAAVDRIRWPRRDRAR